MLKKICSSSVFPLFLLALAAAAGVYAALALDPYSALYSENTKHLLKAYEMLDKLNYGLPWSEILNTVTYPPCFYLNTVLYFKLFQCHNEFTANFSVLTYIIISVWSVYSLIREQSLPAALTASLISVNLFAASLVQEGYLIEYSLTAWVAAVFALTLSCAKMPIWLKIPLLAFCISMGMLCKWNFFTYILPLAACTLINKFYALYLKKTEITKKDCVKGIVIGLYTLTAAAAAFCTMNLWYGAGHTPGATNWQETFSHYHTSHSYELNIHNADPIHKTGFRSHYSGILRFAPVCFALYALMAVCPPYLSLLTAAGCLAAFGKFLRRLFYFRKDPNLRKAELFSPSVITLLSALFIIFIYSFYPSEKLFIPEQSVRHIAPLAPLAVFMAFNWLTELKISGKKTAIVLLAAYALSFASYGSLIKNRASVSHLNMKNIYTLDALASDIIQKAQAYAMLPLPRQGKFNSRYEPDAQNTQLVINLVNKENFDPFFAEIYAKLGEVFIISIQPDPETHKTEFIWTNALMQSPEELPVHLEDFGGFIAVQRILQLKDDELIRNPRGLSRQLPSDLACLSRFYALVYRNDMTEIYQIDFYSRSKKT
ncbi:hypothetical protein IJT93_08940 [bacterium]|nr:hypothetical protein [bacterium]